MIMKDFESKGKFLSLILRHKPETIGIQLDKNGWADVNELLSKLPKNMKMSMEELEYIVENNNKKRYTLSEDKKRIRANQGHSINVDVELQEAIPPDCLYHGTDKRFVPSIEEEGLKPQSRLYVHLSTDFDTAVSVGKRHGNKLHIYLVDTKSMYEDGYKFYLSVNNIWLTKEVPSKYLKTILTT